MPTLAVTVKFEAVERERALQRVHHAARGGFGAGGVGALHQQHELVAAQARDAVDLAHASTERSADLDQHAVAEGPAEVSLMCLKWSRSSCSSAKGSPSRAASASARSTRSASSARLGRPVSASVWASVSMRWLATMRSVMSRNDRNTPDRSAAAALRLHDAFEHAARVQLEHVARLQERRLGDGGEALRVAGGSVTLRRIQSNTRASSTLREQILRQRLTGRRSGSLQWRMRPDRSVTSRPSAVDSSVAASSAAASSRLVLGAQPRAAVVHRDEEGGRAVDLHRLDGARHRHGTAVEAPH